MSEFLAEARIIVRPDTSRFRADLETQLRSVVARPVKIPVVPVVSTAFAATVAGTAAFTAAQEAAGAATVVTAEALASATTIAKQYTGVVDLAAVSTQALAAAQEKEAVTATEAAAAQTAHAKSISQLVRGAGASGLTLFGLRGATLAASGAFLAGTAAVVGFAKAVQSAAALETELNVFRVTAGATADEMQRVSEEAKQLGRDLTLPGITASDAATAMTELAKAGLSVNDSLAAARGTLQLATAAQIDNASAANLVASALNSFELEGTKAVHVADLFAGAAAASQGSIQDFGPALAQASAVAHGFGITIEDTVTLLTQLAKAGLEGGRAGTSLRVAFLRLVKPPADAAKALKDLNIQVRDINGNLRPQVFTDIEAALQGVSKAQRQATEATIFGSDAVRTQILLGQQGAAAFDEIKASVTEAGLAQEQAAARTQGLQGDFENLSNQVSALGLTIGNVAKGPISALVKGLASEVEQATIAVDGLVALGSAVRNFGEDVAGSVPFLDDMVGALRKMEEISNPLSLSLKIAAGAAKQFGIDARNSSGDTNVFQAAADSLTASIDALVASLGAAQNALRQQQPASGVGLNVKQIQNVIEGFDAKAVRDKIRHDDNQLLADLQTERDFLIAQLQRQYVKNRPALKRQIEQQLLGVVNELDAISNQAKSAADKARRDAEAAARAAAAAASARARALLESFAVARQIQENKIAAEAQKAGLEGDIKAEQGLRALVLKQIQQVKLRIPVEEGRLAALAALNAILIQVNGQIKDLVAQQQQIADEQRANLLEGINLDINFAQITGNVNAEIAARRRLITQLVLEQSLTQKGTLAYKKLRNDIAEQNKAIADLTAEKKKQNNAFAQASFEFLQAQQGFASNLLGNLIPTGATAGLVGGGSPVQQALPPLAGAAEAARRVGPTAGQGNTTNHLLERILQQLIELNGDQAAPEAGWQYRQSLSSLDGIGGG